MGYGRHGKYKLIFKKKSSIKKTPRGKRPGVHDFYGVTVIPAKGAYAFSFSAARMTRSVTTIRRMLKGRQISQLRMKPVKM